MARMTYFNNDIEILNYALTLEHLEAAFYVQVVQSGTLKGDEQATFTIIRDHELAHVDALTKAIQAAGGTPVKARQSYNFGDLTSRTHILDLASTFEPTGVGAYDGAAFEFKNKAYLAVAGQIVQVEARHAATIREIDERTVDNPVPMAFERTLRRPEVEAAVMPFFGPAQ
jgi:rubrerythrin